MSLEAAQKSHADCADLSWWEGEEAFVAVQGAASDLDRAQAQPSDQCHDREIADPDTGVFLTVEGG